MRTVRATLSPSLGHVTLHVDPRLPKEIEQQIADDVDEAFRGEKLEPITLVAIEALVARQIGDLQNAGAL